ncbi:MAG: hypothetical protein K9N62_14035 [Verrucomicrobia bacterium]|nr:hypothetical protein [Verrucomicrobiota bacterium]
MSPLHHIGNFLREALLQVPLGVARALFVLLMLTLLIWVLTLPRAEVTAPDRPYRLSENLRVWAAIALGIQVLVYLFL